MMLTSSKSWTPSLGSCEGLRSSGGAESYPKMKRFTNVTYPATVNKSYHSEKSSKQESRTTFPPGFRKLLKRPGISYTSSLPMSLIYLIIRLEKLRNDILVLCGCSMMILSTFWHSSVHWVLEFSHQSMFKHWIPQNFRTLSGSLSLTCLISSSLGPSEISESA